MRLRSVERPGHRATTRHLQAAYPFVAEGGLGGRGVYVGVDASGGSFVYDPFALYGEGLLRDPNMIVLGQVGFGKSSLLKSYLLRQSVFGRRAFVLDPKGEYGELAEALGGVTVRLEPGGSVRLNPLTERAGAEAQQRLLQGVAAGALARALTPDEDEGLRVGLEAVTRHQDTEPTLPDVVEALLHPTSEMADELATTVDAVATACRHAALGLRRLCVGDLRGMFDGPTTAGLDLSAPFVVLDLSEVYGSTALGILMTCATAWLRATVADLRRAAERDGEAGDKVQLVIDEAWRVLSQLGVGEYLQDSFKHSRSYGVANILIMHRLSDLQATGDEGSRVVRLAQGLLADSGTRVIYHQRPDEVPWTRELIGLTETEARLLPELRIGEALWKVGPRSFLVQHRLSEFERDLADTDKRMRDVRAVAASAS
jgi:type IV secretory pathway VirB4 component